MKMLKLILLGLVMFPLAVLGQPIEKNNFTTNANPVAFGTTLFVSASKGNDATASRGKYLPFKTINGANAVAQAGDTVFVYPGVYTETAINRNNVTLQFTGPTCVVSNVANTGSTTNAIIVDSGSITNFSVLGWPTFYYDTGTNVFAYDAPNDIPGGIGATNAYEAIQITNANTTATMQIAEIQFASWQSGTQVQAVNIGNCSNLDLNIRKFTDVRFGSTYTYVSTIIGPIVFTPSVTAFAWGYGNCSLSFDRIGPFEQYGIWCNEAALTHTNNGYFTGNELDTKIYVSAFSRTYRSWFDIKWINCTNSVAGYAADFFGGFNYLRADKVSDTVVGAVDVTSGGTLWLEAQKVSSPTKWINVSSTSSNALFARVLQYEDLGGVNNGIVCAGGTNFFFPGTANTFNASLPSLTGGTNTFDGLIWNGINRFNPPVNSGFNTGLAPVSFTFPASNTNWINPAPYDIEVYIDNGGVTGTVVKKNNTQIFSALASDVTMTLKSNEFFSETYTVGTPSGRWSPK